MPRKQLLKAAEFLNPKVCVLFLISAETRLRPRNVDKPCSPAHAACDNPNVGEMMDCCKIGLKLSAQAEVWWLAAMSA